MKLDFKLRPARPLTRSEAWGCFSANLAMPGSGSLVAGRPVGYLQLGLALLGFAISLVAGIGFIRWYLANSGNLNTAIDSEDSYAGVWMLLRAMFWPVVGIGMYLVSLVWATLTGLLIVKGTPKDATPPRIG